MIKPDCYKNIGKIVSTIEKNGFVISNIKMAKMTLRDAQEFYAEHNVRNISHFRESLSSTN